MTFPGLPPMPTTRFDVTPSAEEVERFASDGFLVVERLTTDEELDWLTELYERLFDPAQRGDPGAPVDRSGERNPERPRLQQAFMPEFQHPELLQTTYHRNARRYATALLGVHPDEITSWSHMIRKAPGGPAAPWHQDEAYWERELDYHALGCWLPLHAVTEEMGAMQFVRGSHTAGVFEHEPLGGDVVAHLLVADVEVDPADIVACPLPKGGATFHDQRTLHFTAPNETDQPRLAYPTEFQTAPVRRAIPAERRWVDDWRRAGGQDPAIDVYPADGAMATVRSGSS